MAQGLKALFKIVECLAAQFLVL